MRSHGTNSQLVNEVRDPRHQEALATRQILWQFLVEAGVLTLMGGATGMIIGAIGAEVVEATTPIPAVIPLWSVIAALAMALLTGMLFGLLPAVRASNLEPVDALRHE